MATPSAAACMATCTNNELIDTLLQEFEGLFAYPIDLPPARILYHRIHLLLGPAPMAIRPYRYPHLQKDELER